MFSWLYLLQKSKFKIKVYVKSIAEYGRKNLILKIDSKNRKSAMLMIGRIEFIYNSLISNNINSFI